MTSPVNVGVKLGVNEFNTGEDSPHIILKTDPDKQALEVLIKTYPVGLYKKQDDGNIHFDYTRCLECGTRRILRLDTALEKWKHPYGTFGAEFCYG